MTEDTAIRSLIFERVLPHPPEKVWRALTESSLIEQWLMKNDFQPVVGHKFNLRSKPMPHWNGVVDCQVLTLEPNQRLAYTWNGSGDEAETGLRTVVTWTLTVVPDGTLVRMEQSGFRSQDAGAYDGASGGWNWILGGLEKVVGGLG